MKLDLKFKNINSATNKIPEIDIRWNEKQLYIGLVKEHISLESDENNSFDLKIYFTNKDPSDTLVDEHNNIVGDLNFELENIVIDDIDLENLKWQSSYTHGNNESIPGCLFFGPKGFWHFGAYLPILKWKLEKNHELLNNDPNWEEDYNYYNQALWTLKNLSKE